MKVKENKESILIMFLSYGFNDVCLYGEERSVHVLIGFMVAIVSFTSLLHCGCFYLYVV